MKSPKIPAWARRGGLVLVTALIVEYFVLPELSGARSALHRLSAVTGDGGCASGGARRGSDARRLRQLHRWVKTTRSTRGSRTPSPVIRTVRN
jgi:hypothetical protein